MKVKIEDIKKLREETGAGVADCRMALEETGGEMKKAREWLLKKGIERADKKSGREVNAGMVFAYVHHTGRLGGLAAVACETDFVAKTEDFQKLGRELALLAAAGQPKGIEEFLLQESAREPGRKIAELISEVVSKLGENIRVLDIKIVKV